MSPPIARADVLIVGAGVLGTFHALWAARAGCSVLLLERNDGPTEASVRNFGMLPQTIVELGGEWAGYARETAAIYRTLQAEGDISLHERGSLYLVSTELERRVACEFARLQPPDLPCRFLEAGEVPAEFPWVNPEYCAGALHFPHDLGLDPRRAVPALLQRVAARAEVAYHPGTMVTAIERQGDTCEVRTAAGRRYQASRVIVCSGAEFRLLYPEHLAAAGLQVCKLQMMRTPPQEHPRLGPSVLSGLSLRRYPAFEACPSFPALMAEPADRYLLNHGVHLLFKQESDGTVTIGDSHEYFPLEQVAPALERTSPHLNDAILAHGRTILHLDTWGPAEVWNGYYMANPAGQVYTCTIDRRIHIVTGIGGKGMTTGPGFARHSMAEILQVAPESLTL